MDCAAGIYTTQDVEITRSDTIATLVAHYNSLTQVSNKQHLTR